MNDVIVVKATNDLNNGINLTNIGEELVAQAGAFGCTLDKAGDIDKFNRGGYDLLALIEFS